MRVPTTIDITTLEADRSSKIDAIVDIVVVVVVVIVDR